MQVVRHSGRSEPYLCTPDCKVSPKHLFFIIFSVMEMAKILIDTLDEVCSKKDITAQSSLHLC